MRKINNDQFIASTDSEFNDYEIEHFVNPF